MSPQVYGHGCSTLVQYCNKLVIHCMRPVAIGYEHVMLPWQWKWWSTHVCKVLLSCTLLSSSYKLKYCIIA